jgi:hypothetical protein
MDGGMKLYAVIRDYGYEGMRPPRLITDDLESAKKALVLLDQTHCIFEYELNVPSEEFKSPMA